MHIDRRQFVQSIVAGAASLVLPAVSVAGSGAWSGFCSTGIGKRLIIGGKNRVHIIDAESLEYHGNVYLDIHPHSFLLSPKRPNELWVIPRFLKKLDENGDPLKDTAPGYADRKYKAMAVDLSTGEIVREIVAPQGSEYKGHAHFAPDSDIIFISRYDAENKKGYLTGYDSLTGQKVEDFYIADSQPHESRYMPDGTVMIASAGVGIPTDYRNDMAALNAPVTDASQQSALFRIDGKSGKKLSFSPITDRLQALAHFNILPDGRILIISRSKLVEKEKAGFPADIYMGKEGETLKSLNFTYEMEGPMKGMPVVPGDMFSIAIEASGKNALVSDYYNNIVFDVDLEAERVVRQYNTDMQGIVHYTNENKFIFYGGRIRKFDADMKHHVFGSPDANRAGPYWGSHGIII